MKRWIQAGTAFLVALLAVDAVMAAVPMRHQPSRAEIAIIDGTTTFDANNLEMFVTNVGNFAYDRSASRGRNDGLYFPKGTSQTAIFAGGIWLGGKINNVIQLSAAEFSDDFTPGPMLDGTYQPDRGSFRVYKIKKGDTRESNPHYRDWPFADGAPFVKDANGDPVYDDEEYMIPLLLGDQALWCVFNDADFADHASDVGLGSTRPLGLEVQLYVFGYARSGALGNTIFMRYNIINKGDATIDSMFVSLWADPDLGGASDDFVGCDTLRSLGFCWNATNADQVYGSMCPAVGYDFFQGPIVPLEEGEIDSAWVSSKGMYIQGYKNLPMTSFNKYINGTDPNNNIEAFNYMRGLSREGDIQIDPFTGQPTKFVLTGDPNAGTGWLDENESDRRYMMSSGPFTMAPNDSQEVVAAVLVGQGTNNRESVDVLKRLDDIAQSVFDANFDIPGPPPPPQVWAVPYDGAIQLLWGTQSDGDVQEALGPPDDEGNQEVIQRFVFEGYNVYQGQSGSGPWTLVGTFDEVNGVERIYFDVDNPAGKERIVTQRGSDAGVAHDLWITQDRINSRAIINNRPYWFAVTAYNFDALNQSDFVVGGNTFGIIAESFENLISSQSVEVTPASYTGVLADTAEHIEGISGGTVLVDVASPGMVTGHTYHVTFNEDASWNLVNTTTQMTELEDQQGAIASQIVDGFVVRVLGPAAGVSAIVEVANGGGPVDPPDNVMYSLNSTGDWYVSSDQANNFGRLNWQGLIGISDWEFRFTENGSEYYDFNTDVKWGNRAPFEVWNIGVGTPDDPSDDRQLQFTVIDDDESGGWSMGDRIYVIELDYFEPLPDNFDFGGNFPDQFHIGRIVFNDNSGNGPPPTGTIARFSTHKPNAMGDIFEFTTVLTDMNDGTVIANTVENVHPVPNPYYNTHALEVDQFNRFIKFINLPPTEVTIRIFNLAGDLVKTIQRTDPTQAEARWDNITNEAGVPIASGLYIYHITAEGLGSKVGKMAIFTEVEQLDNF